MFKSFFKKREVILLFVISTGMAFVLSCTQAGLNLIKQLEARQLKSEAITKRELCFNDFVNEARFKKCYKREVAQLVAEECKTIRQTEPVLQKDCEDFLYRIVMKPDSMFPGMGEDEEFPTKYRKQSLHPTERVGGCDRDAACRDKCQEIFTTSDKRRECYQYSVSAVNSMERVFNKLNDPSQSNLNSLVSTNELRYLRSLLNISVTETLGSLDPWSADQYKAVWNWLGRNKTVADTFYKAEIYENTYEASAHFFEHGSGVIANLNTSLTAEATGKNIIDTMLEVKNEMGLKWIHDMIKQLYPDNNYQIFRSYCEITFHNSNEEKYFRYSFFTKLLDTILQDHQPGSPPDWWTTDTISQDIDPSQWWDSDTTTTSTEGNVCELT